MKKIIKGGLVMAMIAGMASGGAAENWKKKAGTYAVFDTTLGTVVCRLFPEKAPKTVANFTGLAEGTKEFTDMKTNTMAKRPFYDGIIFHRVIPGFMIQSGCPLGVGMGGPGYKFEDEFSKDVNFDKPYVLAMANSGPATNGSQFFITVAPTQWLQGRHTIFGEVVEGQKTVDAIAAAPRDGRDKPDTPIVINALKIERVK